MTREKVANFLTYFCLFLLPWQTVWIYDYFSPLPPGVGVIGDGEYWKLTHYAVQFLVVIAAIVRWKIKTSEKNRKIIQAVWWFYGAVLLSCIFSVSPYLSFGFSFHVLSAVLLFWLLLDERLETKKIIWFFVLGLIIPCLLGWWQVLVGTSPASTLLGLSEHLVSTPGTAVVKTVGGRIMRAYGTFPHPNIFGGYLAVSLMMILMQLTGPGRMAIRPYDRPRYVAVIRTIILILLSSTLVVTFSRSAWLALMVGIFIFLITLGRVMVRPIRKKIPRNFLKGLAVVFVAVVVSSALFHNAIFTRITATDRLETKSLIERQNEYQMIGEVIKINPFLGVGVGSYTVALVEKFSGHEVWFYQPMHNSFLLFFAETGLLGLIFLIYFLWAVFGQYGRRGERPLAPTVIPTIVTLVTIGILDHYLWSQWAGLVLMVVTFVVILRKNDNETNQTID